MTCLQERQACVDARLSPPHLLAMKATLMREAERLGGPPPRDRVRNRLSELHFATVTAA